MESYRIKRKNALPLSSALKEFLRESHLTTGLNTRLIFKAWDDVSGAAPYTLKRFFRNGKLYITLNSSVVLSQLASRKEFLKEMINDRLSRDELFEMDDINVTWVEEIVLK
jgi:predicted nucleic acid-binding Zn ribbon protein